MKKALLAILVGLLLVGTASAAQVTLAWDAVEEPVTGYMIFARGEADEYNYDAPAWTGPETTTQVVVSDQHKTYFVARAYREDSEGVRAVSADSNEVFFFPPPQAPSNLFIQAIDLMIQGLHKLKEAVLAVN